MWIVVRHWQHNTYLKHFNLRLNAVARITRTGRFNSIALFLSTHDGKSFLPINLFNALMDGLAERDHSLICVKLPDASLADEQAVPPLLRQFSTDGLLIDYTHGIPDKLIQVIHRAHLPAVWINSRQDTSRVRPDDEDAAYRATRRLLERGHRHIAWCRSKPVGGTNFVSSIRGCSSTPSTST